MSITKITVVCNKDRGASWPACAEAWQQGLKERGLHAEIVGASDDGAPLVSHQGEVYVLARVEAEDGLLVSAAPYRK
ncbi:hypothetical protein GCM10027294_25940 [Marinactinospora endophytica]